MVKKLLAMLTALMLCAGCCAAFAQGGHEKEDFLGYWQLTEIRLLGMTVSAEAMERKGFISFHEDDTAVFCLDADVGYNTAVTYADGVAKLDGEQGVTCVIGADGKLSCTLASDGISLDLVYVRTDYPALPALMASWPGEYELVSVTMGGLSMPSSALAQFDLWVYEDGYGMFTLGNVKASFRMWEENGAIRGIDRENMSIEARMDEQGQLCLHMPDQGLTIVGRPLNPQPAATDVPSGNPFIGQWESVSATLMGMEFSMDDLGIGNISLRVEQDMAYIVLAGENDSCPTRYEGDTLVFTNGTERIVCTVEDGWLYMAMTVEGVSLRVKMQRMGGAVAETPAEPVANPDFDGTWKPQTYLILGMELPADTVDLSVTLTIAGDAATLDVDGEVMPCSVTYDGNVCILGDSTGDTLEAVLDENGLLSMDLEADGIVMTMKLFRECGAPVVDEPVVDSPVVDAPVVDAPVVDEPATDEPVAVDDFNGDWALAQVERRGSIVSAGQLGLSGSLLVTGSSARYTFGTQSMLGLVEGDGTTLKLVGREAYTFTLNAQGLLTLPATVDGEAVVLRFSRDGVPEVEEPAADAPATGTPATVEGYDGTWELVQVERQGSVVPAQQLGLSGTLTVTGGSARYILDGDSMLGLVTTTETGLTLVVRGTRMEFTLENGYLCRRTLMDGDVVVLRFYRGEVPAEQPVAAADSGFDGVWSGMSAKVMGMDFSLEELGMKVLQLEISGNACFLTDDGGRRAVSVQRDGERLVLTEGASRWVLEPDGQGQAVLEMVREGITVQVRMKKTGGASVVQPAEQPVATQVVCDFCNKVHDAAQSREVIGMTVCPDCYGRYFD